MPFVEILEAAIKDANPENLRAALGEAAPEVARVVPHLRRLFPDIPPPLELPSEQERRYLFNSIQEFIARSASIRPQVAVLDDLHWGDEATLLLLQLLAEHIQEMAVLLLVTFREVELDASRPLARVLEDFLRRHLAHRVSLKRLLPEVLRGVRWPLHPLARSHRRRGPRYVGSRRGPLPAGPRRRRATGAKERGRSELLRGLGAVSTRHRR